MGRLIFLAPAAVFTLVAVLLGWALTSDPSEVPSVLIDKPLPAFDLPPLDAAADGLATADLKDAKVLLDELK